MDPLLFIKIWRVILECHIPWGKDCLFFCLSYTRLTQKVLMNEAELIGVCDSMNFAVCTKLFFELKMKHHNNNSMNTKAFWRKIIIIQDNKNAIQLEICGKSLNTKRTRHITFQYFYVTSIILDLIKSKTPYVVTLFFITTTLLLSCT